MKFKKILNHNFILPLIALAIVGCLGNYFNLPLFFSVDFLFGSIAVLIIVYLYGPSWGTLAAFLASIYTYFAWGHPYAMIIFTCEALFVGRFLKRKGPSMVFLDGMYWLLIGMPLVGFFYGLFLKLPISAVLLIALKQSVNGIFNALMANLIINYLLVKNKRILSRTRRLSLQETILNLLVAFVLLPALTITVFNGNEALTTIDRQVNNELETLASPLQNNLKIWYEQHFSAVKELANIAVELPAEPSEKLQLSTEAIKRAYPSFLKMYVTDGDWNIIASEPSRNEVGEFTIGTNIGSKSKIPKIEETGQALLSEVHADKASLIPHVGINIPLLAGNSLRGIAYGSLDLKQTNRMLEFSKNKEGIIVTLLDSKRQVVASNNPKLRAMETFNLQDTGEVRQLSAEVFQWLPPKSLHKSIMKRWRNSFYVLETPVGGEIPWTLAIQIPTAQHIDYLENIYNKNLATMLAIAIVALFVSLIISKKLVKPLRTLTKVTTDLPQKIHEENTPVDLPNSRVAEIYSLTRNFRSMVAVLHEQFADIQKANETLEERVEERTLELSETNTTLEAEIDQRHQAEAALREREERYDLAVSGTNDGVWDWDMRTNEVYYSPVWMKILGYEDNNLLLQELSTWSDNVHPNDLEGAIRDITAHLEGKTKLYENTHRMKHRDGHYLWTAAKGRCIRDKNGVANRLVGTMTDITKRVQAQEELRTAKVEAEVANKAKSEFLATMSHEIRTPMNAVIGMTGLLLDTELSDVQREFTEIIRNSGDALLAIINDILDFSKIESGKLELEEQTFNLRNCIEESIDLLAPRAAGKGVELAYLMMPETPETIVGDITRLRQVLVNLLSNAVKFTAKGEVVVRVESRLLEETGETQVVGEAITKSAANNTYEFRFAVQDTGIGIPQQRMERLFEAFSQVDASTTRQYGGTGLGLAIGKRLTQMMGGTMWVESQMGKGSTFFFTIKASGVPSSPLWNRPLVANVLAGKSLLIVDDNATNRLVLKLQTKSFGMTSQEAESGEEALSILRGGQKFDLAILDMQMPHMDGVMLAAEIRKLPGWEDVPLVMLSSMGHFDRSESDSHPLFAAYLNKPIKQSQLYNISIDIFDKNASVPSPVQASEPDLLLGERLPLKILLAEDNAVNQKVAINILNNLGYRADIAGNGLEVLEALRRQPYDVVFMDVQMPEMDGLTATRVLCERRSPSERPRIIAMTANAMESDRDACLEAGMDDYLSKPIRLEALIAALNKCSPKTKAATARDVETITEETVDISMAASPMPETSLSVAPSPMQETPAEVAEEPIEKQAIAPSPMPESPPEVAEELQEKQAIAPSPMPETPPEVAIEEVLDMRTLQDLQDMVGDDVEGMVAIVDCYLEDAPEHLEQIEEAIAQGNAGELQMKAHSLKSSSASFGANVLAKMCKELEFMGRNRSLDGAAELFSRTMAEYQRVDVAINQFKNQIMAE
ncbi:MAG: response regulator [Cyanobacteriota bacterium]|nr:response regulator [Cyanobacteriota bacterium]